MASIQSSPRVLRQRSTKSAIELKERRAGASTSPAAAAVRADGMADGSLSPILRMDHLTLNSPSKKGPIKRVSTFTMMKNHVASASTDDAKTLRGDEHDDHDFMKSLESDSLKPMIPPLVVHKHCDICPCDEAMWVSKKDHVAPFLSRVVYAPADTGDTFKDKWQRARMLIHLVLEEPEFSILAKAVSFLIVFCIVVATITICLETMPALEGNDVAWNTIETVIIIIFSIEYILKVATTKSLVEYHKNIFNLVDIAAVLPYYLEQIFPGMNASVFTLLRIVRLARLFKLLKLPGLQVYVEILTLTLTRSYPFLSLLGYFIMIAIIILSSPFYLSEKGMNCDDQARCIRPGSAANPNEIYSPFTSIPATFWWAIQTMSAVGYGDDEPLSFWGMLISCISCICGFLVLSLPISIIGTFFYEGFSKVHSHVFTTKDLYGEVYRAEHALRKEFLEIQSFLNERHQNNVNKEQEAWNALKQLSSTVEGEPGVNFLDSKQQFKTPMSTFHTVLNSGLNVGDTDIPSFMTPPTDGKTLLKTSQTSPPSKPHHDANKGAVEQNPRVLEGQDLELPDVPDGDGTTTPRASVVTTAPTAAAPAAKPSQPPPHLRTSKLFGIPFKSFNENADADADSASAFSEVVVTNEMLSDTFDADDLEGKALLRRQISGRAGSVASPFSGQQRGSNSQLERERSLQKTHSSRFLLRNPSGVGRPRLNSRSRLKSKGLSRSLGRFSHLLGKVRSQEADDEPPLRLDEMPVMQQLRFWHARYHKYKKLREASMMDGFVDVPISMVLSQLKAILISCKKIIKTDAEKQRQEALNTPLHIQQLPGFHHVESHGKESVPLQDVSSMVPEVSVYDRADPLLYDALGREKRRMSLIQEGNEKVDSPVVTALETKDSKRNRSPIISSGHSSTTNSSRENVTSSSMHDFDLASLHNDKDSLLAAFHAPEQAFAVVAANNQNNNNNNNNNNNKQKQMLPVALSSFHLSDDQASPTNKNSSSNANKPHHAHSNSANNGMPGFDRSKSTGKSSKKMTLQTTTTTTTTTVVTTTTIQAEEHIELNNVGDE